MIQSGVFFENTNRILAKFQTMLNDTLRTFLHFTFELVNSFFSENAAIELALKKVNFNHSDSRDESFVSFGWITEIFISFSYLPTLRWQR